jgi:hypothetical protein
MGASCISCGRHAKLSAGIAGKKIALNDAVSDHLPRLDTHAFLIKRRTAHAARLQRIFFNLNMLWKDTLIQAV